jgi:hypothetical protein
VCDGARTGALDPARLQELAQQMHALADLVPQQRF